MRNDGHILELPITSSGRTWLRALLMVTLPMWFALIPAVFFLYLLFRFWNSSSNYLDSILWYLSHPSWPLNVILCDCLLDCVFLVCCTLLIGTFLAAFRYLTTNLVLVSELGIQIPQLTFSLRNTSYNHILWSDIKEIELSEVKSSGDQVKLIVLYGPSDKTIELCVLTPNSKDVQDLFERFFLYLPPDAIGTKLLQCAQAKGQTIIPSYTRLWDESIGLCAGAANDSALGAGAFLKDHTLQIVRPLATGGTSTIYLAKSTHQELFIVKELKIDSLFTEQEKNKLKELFNRETELLRLVNHQKIVKVFDSFEEDSKNYLQLEYLEGPNLREYCDGQGLHDLDVVDFGTQMCEILVYLHSQSPPLIHRDINPENFVLVDGQIHLIDFGAANLVGKSSRTVVGKCPYMPPEQLRGDACIKSDLYALGGTLYFLATGKEPTPLTQVNPNKEGYQLCKKLNNLIIQLTAQNSDSRPESAQDVLCILAGCSSEYLLPIEQLPG